MKTKESFQKELDLKYNGKITLLSEYVDSHDKIKCRCNIDNTIWWQTPTSWLTGKIGCPTCCGNQIRERCKKSNEDFISQLNIANPNLIPLEEYIDSEKKKPVPENYNIPVYTISEYDVIWRYIK